MEYKEAYLKLTYETAGIIFIKKDGTIRSMLATRNIKTAEMFGYPHLGGVLGGHDNRCNIHNGNMAVIDLMLGEGRAFNMDRLVSVTWFGEITNTEESERVYKDFKKFAEEYSNSKPKTVSLDELTSLDNVGKEV